MLTEKSLILAIADTGGTFKAEDDDGRTLEFCFFCDADVWDGEAHKDSCIYNQAIKNEVWIQELETRKERAINIHDCNINN